MDAGKAHPELWYTPQSSCDGEPAHLVLGRSPDNEQRFPFFDQIELGRDLNGPSDAPGVLLLPDEVISRRHCIITLTAGGKFYIRDVSRNGTRVDGRRLVPNLETELKPGQVIQVGQGYEFALVAGSTPATRDPSRNIERTTSVPGEAMATVLVGDIRDYTVLVRTARSLELQQSVGRVFEALTEVVVRHGGTVKEYHGDAVFAYWEESAIVDQVVAACRATVALDRISHELAQDANVWKVPDLPLRIDWALATGQVVIDSFGGRVPAGLSMVGEAVVRAFRLEKLATDETGSILVCALTRMLADGHFQFRDLGKLHAKGFDKPERVFALSPLEKGSP